MQGLMMDCQLTISSILERAETLFGHKEIISYLPDRSIHRCNYRTVTQRSVKLSKALRYLGVREGDRVATFCWNHHQHVEAYFAIANLGAIIHTLNIRLSAGDLSHIINEAKDKIIIVDQVLLPLFVKFKSHVKPDNVIVIRQSDESIPQEYLIYEEVLGMETHEEFKSFAGNENTAALLCYTSGTTGKPKGVLYSHRSVVLNTMINLLNCTGIGITESDVVLSAVPMFHAAAWGFPFSCTFTGATQVLPGPHLDASSLVDLIACHQVTITGAVPTVFVNVLNYLNDHPEKHLHNLKKIIVGGSAVPKYLITDYKEKFGVSILHTWGMTELSPLGSTAVMTSQLETATPDEQLDFSIKQGIPIPLLKIRARNEDGLVPWDGKSPGALEVRGPTVASGYYLSTESSETFTEDGWLKTGDIAVIHPNGFIELKDRNKDIIKSGGEWISSIMVENTLAGHPAVLEAAVISVPDTKWIERPYAYIVLRVGCTCSAEALKEYLKDKIAKFWIPDEYNFIESIPKTSVGKTMKSDLRKKYFDENIRK